ncbi:MAG: DinB family protein [Anaerolineae bacterium]|nr:DinB family protein [Anaerolineae bacterium]
MTLADRLARTVEDFCEWVQQQPDSEKAWGPKEVLAHLGYWQANYPNQAEALLAGRNPTPPDGSFDALNSQTVRASYGVPMQTLIERFQAANGRFVTLLTEHDPRQIMFSLKIGSEKKSLADHAHAEIGHIQAHLTGLQNQQARQPQTEAENLRKSLLQFSEAINGLPPAEREAHTGQLAETIALHIAYVAQINHRKKRPLAVNNEKAPYLHALITELQHQPWDKLTEQLTASIEPLCSAVATLDPQMILLWVKIGSAFHLVTLDDAARRIAARIDKIIASRT